MVMSGGFFREGVPRAIVAGMGRGVGQQFVWRSGRGQGGGSSRACQAQPYCGVVCICTAGGGHKGVRGRRTPPSPKGKGSRTGQGEVVRGQ